MPVGRVQNFRHEEKPTSPIPDLKSFDLNDSQLRILFQHRFDKTGEHIIVKAQDCIRRVYYS